MTTRFEPRRLIEHQYAYSMDRLVSRVFAGFDFDDPLTFLDLIDKFLASEIFQALSYGMARRMVTATYAHGCRSWREAATKGTMGREIYQALKWSMQGNIGDLVRQTVDTNAALISSVPRDIGTWISNYVLIQQQAGRRNEDIAKDLKKKLPQLTKSRVNLIARTEAAKASTALVRAQSQDLGINWFIWRTAHDGRVRSSHAHMDGVLINWNDLPSPELLKGMKNEGRYGPGEIYNCRCFPAPLIELKYLEWPMKVYQNGHIFVIRNQKQFERMVA